LSPEIQEVGFEALVTAVMLHLNFDTSLMAPSLILELDEMEAQKNYF